MRIQVPEVRFSLQDDECVRNPIEHARGCSLNAFCSVAAVGMAAANATRWIP